MDDRVGNELTRNVVIVIDFDMTNKQIIKRLEGGRVFRHEEILY